LFKIGQNSAAELSGHSTFYSALFYLCGRTIGQFAVTLKNWREKIGIIKQLYAFLKLWFILRCHILIQEVIKMVVLPDKPAVVALIDSEKVNLFLSCDSNIINAGSDLLFNEYVTTVAATVYRKV